MGKKHRIPYFQQAKMDILVKSKSRARQGLYRCLDPGEIGEGGE